MSYHVVEVRKTLAGALRFLDRLRDGTAMATALIGVRQGILRSLNMFVLVDDLNDVWEITDASEMRMLMASGATPRRGNYHPQYRAFKLRHGLPPHVLTGTMTSAIFVDIHANRVLFGIPTGAITPSHVTPTTRMRRSARTGRWHYFNFGPIHERRKSILKSTIVFGWRDIMVRLTEAYRRIAEAS